MCKPVDAKIILKYWVFPFDSLWALKALLIDGMIKVAEHNFGSF